MMRIVVSSHALAETTERLFPESKNRSKRIGKKLIKRFGGEFRKAPAAFQSPAGLIIHPTLYDRLKRELPDRVEFVTWPRRQGRTERERVMATLPIASPLRSGLLSDPTLLTC